MSDTRRPEEIIADLERRLAMNEKVIQALKDRVKRSVHSMENSFTLFENNILLQAAVDEKTQALEIAKNDAEAHSRAKSEFLANMSHELRTPLHSILAYAQFGLRDAAPEPADIREYFEHIHTGGVVLLDLLNDLLDLAKLESGRMVFENMDTVLQEVIESSIAEFGSQASLHHACVELDSRLDGLVTVLDPTKFQQLLRNLISNALKFSPEGGVVNVVARVENEDVIVEVLDEGVGISEDELESIFDKFIQSSKTKSGAGGTGLGLAICREIIASLDGVIFADNRPGGGAAFTVRFPVRAGEPAAV